MDFAALFMEHFVLVVVLACLIVGYLIKHASFLTWVPNGDIPVILCVFGALLNGVVSGFNVESIVYGAFMGLASTGMHQAFKKWIENNNKVEE